MKVTHLLLSRRCLSAHVGIAGTCLLAARPAADMLVLVKPFALCARDINQLSVNDIDPAVSYVAFFVGRATLVPFQFHVQVLIKELLQQHC